MQLRAIGSQLSWGLCVWQGWSSQARDTAQLASSRPPCPPPQARGHPAHPTGLGLAFLSVCFQEPEEHVHGQHPQGTLPHRGCSPPPPPPSLLRVLLWRAPCRALDLYHIHLHGNPRKGAPPSQVEGRDSEKQSDFPEGNTRCPRLKPKDRVCPPLSADSPPALVRDLNTDPSDTRKLQHQALGWGEGGLL